LPLDGAPGTTIQIEKGSAVLAGFDLRRVSERCHLGPGLSRKHRRRARLFEFAGEEVGDERL
jgi:hypothetical protein